MYCRILLNFETLYAYCSLWQTQIATVKAGDYSESPISTCTYLPTVYIPTSLATYLYCASVPNHLGLDCRQKQRRQHQGTETPSKSLTPCWATFCLLVTKVNLAKKVYLRLFLNYSTFSLITGSLWAQAFLISYLPTYLLSLSVSLWWRYLLSITLKEPRYFLLLFLLPSK